MSYAIVKTHKGFRKIEWFTCTVCGVTFGPVPPNSGPAVVPGVPEHDRWHDQLASLAADVRASDRARREREMERNKTKSLPVREDSFEWRYVRQMVDVLYGLTYHKRCDAVTTGTVDGTPYQSQCRYRKGHPTNLGQEHMSADGKHRWA